MLNTPEMGYSPACLRLFGDGTGEGGGASDHGGHSPSADLEMASAIPGHGRLDINQVYVHRDNKTAAAWAATHG